TGLELPHDHQDAHRDVRDRDEREQRGDSRHHVVKDREQPQVLLVLRRQGCHGAGIMAEVGGNGKTRLRRRYLSTACSPTYAATALGGVTMWWKASAYASPCGAPAVLSRSRTNCR